MTPWIGERWTRSLGRLEHELHIGLVESRNRLHERRGFEDDVGQWATTEQQILGDIPEISWHRAQRDAVGHGIAHAHVHRTCQMVVKIAPDPRKIMPYRNAQGSEVFAVADSGEHQ